MILGVGWGIALRMWLTRRNPRRRAPVSARPIRGAGGRRLSVETLEDRRVLAALGSAASFSNLVADGGSFAAARLLVQYRDGASMAGSLGAYSLGSNVGSGWSLVPGLREVQLHAGVDVEAALKSFQTDSNVLFAQPDYRVSVQMTPSDPSFDQQWDFQNTGQTGGKSGADISAPGAWDVTTGNTSVTVAVIDTGVDYNHPDLYRNIWINQAEIPQSRLANLVDIDGDGLITFRDLNDPQNQGPFKITDVNKDGRIDGSDILANMQKSGGQDTGNGGWADGISEDGDTAHLDDLLGWDVVDKSNDPVDDYFHGTHVAGTIAATINNGVGIAGVAPDVRLMPLKFLDSSGSGYTSDAITALNYAVANGATISNNSWGGGPSDSAMLQALKNAAAAGHIFVAAAGNDGNNNDANPSYPASYNVANVVAVAATDNTDNLAYFSNYGRTSVDIAAPGVDIYSTMPTHATAAMQSEGFGPNYGTLSGTSMATPHVAGAIALIRSIHPDWSYSQVIQQLLTSSDKITGLKTTVANGRLNAAAAVGGSSDTPPPPSDGGGDTTPPRITGNVVTDPGYVYQVTLTFSEAIDPYSFDTGDIVSFDGPSGTLFAASVYQDPSNPKQFIIGFDPQTTPGSYKLVIGPHIADLAGNELDQNRNGTPGENPGDDYTVSFSIAGETLPPPPPSSYPQITSSTPNTTVTGPVNHVRLTFSEAMDVSSFDPSDIVSLYGPGGYIPVLAVNPVGTAQTRFDVMFDPQYADGDYTLVVGPHISDTLGYELDQNGNGSPGEDPDDDYSTSFTISSGTSAPGLGPQIIGSDPANATTGSIDHVRLTFSEPIDPATFDTSDIVSFYGPSGYIYVWSVTPASSDDTQFDLQFDPQSASGTYSLLVGPHISDFAGQELDQNGDGIGGDDSSDAYSLDFSLAGALTFMSQEPPKTIRGFTAVASTITVDQDVPIADLDVQLNISFPRDGNLSLMLVSPSGVAINLAYRHGGSKSGFIDTIFDDQAAVPISAGKAPFAGSYAPDDALATFTGQSALGDWKLLIQNVSTVNNRGTLNYWSINVTPDTSGGGGGPPGGDSTAPVAGADSFQTYNDSPLIVWPADLLANDYDPAGNGVSVSWVNSGSGGSVIQNSDGSITFTPDPSFTGAATFTYGVSNGVAESTGAVEVDVLPAYDWYNYHDPNDVNNDGFVAPNDALLIINRINAAGTGPLTGTMDVGRTSIYYDVSRDNIVSPIDALMVINYLNGRGSAASGEGEAAAASTSAANDSLAALDQLFATMAAPDDPNRRLKGGLN
jgi:subtilisin family serine protease/subtilisin-like proprotein convertase family protein